MKQLQPIICLDVKISAERIEQLIIFEGDDIDLVIEEFAKKNSTIHIFLIILELPDSKKLKL